MITGACSSGQPCTRTSFLFRKGVCFSLIVACPILFLCSMMPSLAQAQQAGEVSPFANHLATPPAFNPDTAEEKDEPDCTMSDSQRGRPLACVTGKASDTNRVSAKSKQLSMMDITHLPPPAAGSKKIRQAIAISKKDEMMENEWKMGFELRGSPVKEEHGDPERHDSIGGLIKGNMKF